MLSTQSSQPPSVCHSSDLRVSPSSHSSRTRTENQQTTSSVCQVTTLCRHDGKPSRPHHQSVRLLHCVVTTENPADHIIGLLHCVVTTENPADRIISLSGYYTVSSPTSLRREEARPGGANEVEWSVYLGLLCMLRVPLHYSHLKRTVVTHTGLSHDVTNTDS